MKPPHSHARAAVLGALATYGLTVAHHTYGAVVYRTPWRHHASVVTAIASIVLWLAYRAYSQDPASTRGRIGLVGLLAAAGLYAVLAIGVFEGLYNHVLKNVLYFAALPLELLRQLFPPPTYELPNDAIFELSGIAQVVPATYTAIALVRLLGRARST